jgi:citrate lyase subunit beta/citryl-CoA lyase
VKQVGHQLPFILDSLFGTTCGNRNIAVCDHYAGTEKTMRKSLLLQSNYGPALDVTLDFEDGSSVGDELQQRQLIHDALNSQNNFSGKVGVRIHSVNTHHWQLDIDAIIKQHGILPSYINIPKVQGREEIQQVDSYVKNKLAENARHTTIPIHVMLEDVSTLMRVSDLTTAPSVECVSFGLLDFVGSLGGIIPNSAISSPGQFEHPLIRDAKIKLAIACHAANVIPSHSITIDIHDSTRAYNDARRARDEFGYMRMWSIHPSQIEPIIRAFQHDNNELEDAIAILNQAREIQWAPIMAKGIMQDMASYRILWMKLRRAAQSGLELPKDTDLLLRRHS